MSKCIINSQNPDESDVLLLGVGYDVTASGRKGASKGPGSIVQSLNTQLEFFDRFTADEPTFLYKIAYEDLKGVNLLSPEKMVEAVSGVYTHHLSKDQFVVLLGGEHSVTIGALTAIARVEQPSDVSIIHIDAHFDLRDSDVDYNDHSPSQFAHSCVMRRASELGFPIITVGVRTGSKEEYLFAKKNITFFEWGKDDVPSIDTILASVKTKKVYVTIDVDGIDPSQMPATGTPVQGGLEWNYVVNLVRQIFQKKEVVGSDIVEVAPIGESALTEYGAAQLCYLMISGKMH